MEVSIAFDRPACIWLQFVHSGFEPQMMYLLFFSYLIPFYIICCVFSCHIFLSSEGIIHYSFSIADSEALCLLELMLLQLPLYQRSHLQIFIFQRMHYFIKVCSNIEHFVCQILSFFFCFTRFIQKLYSGQSFHENHFVFISCYDLNFCYE